MSDYNAKARAFWLATFATGLLALAWSLQTVVDGGGLLVAQVLLGAVVVGLTGLFTVRIPGAMVSIAAAEIFIFLMLLVLGPEAATIAAAVEGAVGAMRSSRRWTSRLGTPALAATAMFVCGHALTWAFGQLPPTRDAALLFVALAAFATLYAVLSSHLVYTLMALKNDKALGVLESLRQSRWLVVAYVCSASLSAMMYLSYRTYGWTVIVVGAPIIGMFLSTLHFYFRQRSVEHEAAATAEHLEAMRVSENRFHRAFTHAAIGMALVSTDGRLVQVNDSLCAMLGRRSDEMKGAGLDVVAHPDDFGELLARVHQVMHGAPMSQSELRFGHADGSTVWCALHIAVFDEASSGARCLIVQAQNVTSRRLAEAKLRLVAYHDQLTSLPNRAYFMKHLKRVIASPRSRRSFAVMYLDFDRFKVINDSLGHKAGDAFLAIIASRLAACLSPRDVIARLGGDEFAILLKHVADEQIAFDLAARLIAVVATPVQLAQAEVTTSASIGITFGTMDYDKPEDVLRDADIAMYKAKADGKAQYAVFDATLHEHVSAQLKLEGDLRRALTSDQLIVHYQPIFSLATSHLLGFEALVRWNHPQSGMVDPGRFIPIAEEAGLIVALGDIVFGKACAQLAAWRTLLSPEHRLTMNVNVSGVQLAHPGFVDRVTACLQGYGLQPNQINLEVTESVLMDIDGVVPVMRRLADLGIQLSIDDFGTGYSSLSYLHSLPFDTLKIDRSFVDRIDEEGQGHAIVRSIVALAKALGKTLLAEGIETAEQLERLRALGVEEGQGYYFSRPLAATAITPLLSTWSRTANATMRCADEAPWSASSATQTFVDETGPSLADFLDTTIIDMVDVSAR